MFDKISYSLNRLEQNEQYHISYNLLCIFTAKF